MKRLRFVVPLSIALIRMLLYGSLRSWRLAALVLVNLPFAAVGGVAALRLRGLHLSVSASVGFIAPFGVAVLNGLVLLSTVQRLRQEGASAEEAATGGVRKRLRPVLMTALVASIGFIPVAISAGRGAEVQRPLATVVIGGLITSTLLTLLVLPTLYAWIERRTAGLPARSRAHNRTSGAPGDVTESRNSPELASEGLFRGWWTASSASPGRGVHPRRLAQHRAQSEFRFQAEPPGVVGQQLQGGQLGLSWRGGRSEPGRSFAPSERQARPHSLPCDRIAC